VKRGTRFAASGNDSSEREFGRVDGCSEEGGLDGEAVGESDADMALLCDGRGGDVCGVMALDFGSCFGAAVASTDGSLE
jgi:hypothetical protein